MMDWDKALDKLEHELKSKAYSTQRNYLRFCENFRTYAGKPLSKVTIEDCQAFTDEALAAASQNHRAAALRFFFLHVFNKSIPITKRSRGKQRGRESTNYSRTKINAMIKRTPYPYQAAACLMYGCGLKVGEVVRLKRSDINKKEVTVKNRKVPMSRKYWHYIYYHLRQHSEELVFISEQYNSMGQHKPLSVSAIQKYIDIKPMALRDQFAKDHVKNGASLSDVQYLLGLVSPDGALKYFDKEPRQVKLPSPADL